MDDIDFNKLIFHAENRIIINTNPPVYVPNTFLLKSDMLKTLSKVYMADPSRENDEFGNPLFLKLEHENISAACWTAFTQSINVEDDDDPLPSKCPKKISKGKLYDDEYYASPKRTGKKIHLSQKIPLSPKIFINDKYVTEPTELDNIVYLCIKYGFSSEYMFKVIKASEYNAFGTYVFPKIQEMQSNTLITDLLAHIFREACKEFRGSSRIQWYDQVQKTSPWLYGKLTQHLIHHHIYNDPEEDDFTYI